MFISEILLGTFHDPTSNWNYSATFATFAPSPGALICSEVLGRKHASNSELKSFFSSVPLSFLTHIQLVLVEGWPAISGPMLTDSKFWAAYLVIFICLSNFALLNLVTGVVCERVMELARQLPPATAEEKQFEFDLLKQQMAEIYDATPKRFPDHLNQHEYSRLFKSILASELLDELKVTLPTHSDLLRCLIDEDDNGKVTCAELQEGLMRLRGNRFDDVSRAMQCTVRKCTHRCIRSLDEAEVDVTKALTEVCCRSCCCGCWRLGTRQIHRTFSSKFIHFWWTVWPFKVIQAVCLLIKKELAPSGIHIDPPT